MPRRSLSDWASIAEITSAIAVVASLVYVGYELRQNTNAVHSSTQQSMLELIHGLDAWLQDSEFADVVLRGRERYGDLSANERLRFDTFTRNYLNLWETAYYNNRAGLMDDDLWLAWNASFLRARDAGVWRVIWDRDKIQYGQEFRDYVDSLE
jgi:hypothetical protein